MTIEKTQYGSVKISAIHKGFFIQRSYFGHTQTQAKKIFIQELKNI